MSDDSRNKPPVGDVSGQNASGQDVPKNIQDIKVPHFSASEIRYLIGRMLGGTFRKGVSFDAAVKALLKDKSAWKRRILKANPALEVREWNKPVQKAKPNDSGNHLTQPEAEKSEGNAAQKKFEALELELTRHVTRYVKYHFALSFNRRYRQAHQQNIAEVSDEEPSSSRGLLQWIGAFAMGFVAMIDFLLFSIPSCLWHWGKRHEKAADNAKNSITRQRHTAGEYLRPRHDRKLARAITDYLSDQLSQEWIRQKDPKQNSAYKVSKKSFEPFEEAFDAYKPRWQSFWYNLGFSISFSYGVGSAIMVFFLVYMAGWPVIPLVLALIVFCGANLVVNTKFAIYYMPKVFQWLFSQGGVLQGLYAYEKYDNHGNVISAHDLNDYQKSIVRMGFALSVMSAMAMASLTFTAIVWAFTTMGAAPAAIPVAAAVGVITMIMMTVLFTYFWKEVAQRGGLFSYIKHLFDSMTVGMKPEQAWATRALFVINFVIVAVGFTYLALICLPYGMALLSPLAVYIALGPGIIAQIPNLLSFTTSMSRKMVLKIDQYYIKDWGSDWLKESDKSLWVNWMPRSFRIGCIALFILVAEVLRMTVLIAIISALFVPIVIGLLVSEHIQTKVNKQNNVDPDLPWADDYALSFDHLAQYVRGGSNTLVCFLRGVLVALLTIIPCLPLVILINHIELGFAKRKALSKHANAQKLVQNKQLLYSKKENPEANMDKKVDEVKENDEKSEPLEESQEGPLQVTVPRPALHVLLFNEVLSNAMAYSVDVANHSINLIILFTTFVFTYFQRGDTQIDYKRKEHSVVEVSKEHWKDAIKVIPIPIMANLSKKDGEDKDLSGGLSSSSA